MKQARKTLMEKGNFILDRFNKQTIVVIFLFIITIAPLFSQANTRLTLQGYVYGYVQEEVEFLPGAHISVWNNDSTLHPARYITKTCSPTM